MVKIIKKGIFVKNFNFVVEILVKIPEKSVLYKRNFQKKDAYERNLDFSRGCIGNFRRLHVRERNSGGRFVGWC